MALLHLDLLGGPIFQWVLALLVLITVLAAVIAGLVMAASASITQDLIPTLWPKMGSNVFIARLSVGLIFLAGRG